MDPLIQCPLCKNRELSLGPRTLTEEPGTQAHACKPALEK